MPISFSQECRLKTQHLTIVELTEGISEELLLNVPESGKWNIKDHITHLVRYQFVFNERLEKITLSDSSPEFTRYIAEEEIHFQEWRDSSLNDLYHHLKEARKNINDLIFSLPDEKLFKTGLHPKYGMMSLPQWVEFFLLHEAHHIFSIFNLINR